MESSRGGSHNSLVVLGLATEPFSTVVERAAKKHGYAVHYERDVASAVAWRASQAEGPTAIATDLESPGAARELLNAPDAQRFAGVPILGLTRRVDDLAFEEAFSTSIDDVCRLDEGLLARRLRLLADRARDEVTLREDTIVVADADRATRMAIGRVFREAGFTIQFAMDASDTLAHARAPKTVAVIASAAIEREGVGGAPLSRASYAEGGRAAWVINTSPREIPEIRRLSAPEAEQRFAVHDAFAAPTTLLFVVNDLLNRPARDVRQSERLLYASSLRFRLAGRADDDCGATYNLSEGGLYVRTLAPPERWEELWIELVPPRTDRRVHLEATVVWSRRFGPSTNASVPPGFGVQLTGGSKGDLERYQRGYQTFLDERTHGAPVPPSA